MTRLAKKKNGLLLLTMPRSGSNWLASISNQTEEMGCCGEWLGFDKIVGNVRQMPEDSFYNAVLKLGSTPNGNIAIKLFPRHLRQVSEVLGFDFIRRFTAENNTKILLLWREDRLAQSVSFVRAYQSQSWTDNGIPNTRPPRQKLDYCFKTLCDAYFHIGRGYDFWRSYLEINNMPYDTFKYEDLLSDPAPYFNSISEYLNVPNPKSYETNLSIQRNEQSDAWAERFRKDIAKYGVPPETYHQIKPSGGVKNAIRLIRGQSLQSTFFGFKA